MYEANKMYAVLHSDNKTVVDVIPPDKTIEEITKWANGRKLIEMTIENSPGYVGGIYENGKFYSPKELING
jgi:hypothetical protein